MPWACSAAEGVTSAPQPVWHPTARADGQCRAGTLRSWREVADAALQTTSPFWSLTPAFPAAVTLAPEGKAAWDELPPDDSYCPVVHLTSGGEVHIADGKGSGPRRPASRVSARSDTLMLAETSTNFIHLTTLRDDHPQELGPILDLITNVATFESLFEDVSDDPRRPISRGMSSHAERLRQFDIVDEGLARRPTTDMLLVVWCTLFLVAKKVAGLARLVIDARPINRRQRKPMAMHLPSIHGVIAQILEWEVASSCDGKSYFYQFPLAPGIARYFRARLGALRGHVTEVCLKRMPMGWSFSPAIAQRVANVLVRDLGIAWVDDFIIGGTRQEYAAKRSEFLRRLRRYNVEVDDDSLEPSESFEALGMEFDLRKKVYRVKPAWAAKREAVWRDILQRSKEGSATFREVFELFGGLIWSDYVMCRPLWLRAEALAALRALAKDVEREYDKKVKLPAYAHANTEDWIAETIRNPWSAPHTRIRPSQAHELLFSDASSTGGAWIRIFKGQVVDGDAWQHKQDLHIYYQELFAMCEAASRSGCDPRNVHIVDNAPAVGSATRGHSSAYPANVLLRATYGHQRPSVWWAPTDMQLADPYTRGQKLPALPCPVSPSQREVIAALDAQGLPDSNRINS